MKSFLGRLFRYKASGKKTPLEDFLSETLADFINRAPNIVANKFVSDCFVPTGLRTHFQQLLADQRVDVRTQTRLPDGRQIDLLVEIAGHPVAVIENKIWAAFQMHQRLRTGNENDDPNIVSNDEADPARVMEYDNQLVTYGRWLAEQQKRLEQWPGVITLLTHVTRAPIDFADTNSSHYGAAPHVIRWRNVHAHLKLATIGVEADSDLPAWKFVGRELCTFLEERAMGSSDLTSIDIASIKIAMSPLRKMDDVFEEVGAELLHRHPEHFVLQGQGGKAEAEHSLIWGWTFFEGKRKSYLAYGINFTPAAGDHAAAEPPLPDYEHAFVAFGSDRNDIEAGPDGLAVGWIRAGWHVLKPYPLTEQKQGERLPQFLLRIIEKEFDTLISIKNSHEA